MGSLCLTHVWGAAPVGEPKPDLVDKVCPLVAVAVLAPPQLNCMQPEP